MKNIQTLLTSRAFVVVALLAFALPIVLSFYKYYVSKNYNYIVEAKCDSTNEICYTRDCSNPDDCPPNGLSRYKQYLIKAYDFAQCADNSCEEECNKGKIQCIPIPCGSSVGDECSNPLQ